MTTDKIVLTQNEKDDFWDAVYDIHGLLIEEVWKMTEQRDFERVASVVKAELRKFRENHSEEATRTLAEKICEYAVFDVGDDTLWQMDACEYQFEMKSRAYGLSAREYSETIEWTWYNFQVYMDSENDTVLRLFANIDGKNTIVRKIIVW